jgi:putative ABC transport system permease protein
MKLDEMKYAVKSLNQRKLRSFLTILSILIGIASVFALVSFGMGMQSYVSNLAEESGTDKFFVQSKGIGPPGSDENFYLVDDDIDFIEKINGVDEVSGIYFKMAELEFDDQKKYNYLMGLETDSLKMIEESFTVKVEIGRQLKDGDLYKVVMGHNYLVEKKIFDEALKLGDKILIDGNKFEIIGFYEEVGNPNDDAQIYITREAYELVNPDQKNKFGFMIGQVQDSSKTQEMADKIQEKLRKYKDQEEGKEDFFIQTFEDALETFSSVLGVINGILFLIVVISLVVASVNIMNTMYTAVLERTKEIGIMKAVGARNEDILFIFIFESGFLGAIGGVIGVIVGFLIAKAGGAAAAASGFSSLYPIFPWWLIVGCILFAFAVGAIAGVTPAMKAAKLKPVDALRYE